MARIINPEEHAEKQNQILDSAQRLIYAKGFQQMSIQDILLDVNISKGAFYHYFDSKSALLEALVIRMQHSALAFFEPIVADPSLPAMEKLTQYFSTIASWKTGQMDLLLKVFRGWYSDENAIVREKMMVMSLEMISPMIRQIIQQGIREGVVDSRYPDQLSQVVLSHLFAMGNLVAMKMLPLLDDPTPAARQAGLVEIAGLVDAYTDALERILGAAPGSVTIFNTNILQEWLEPQVVADPLPAQPQASLGQREENPA